LTDGPQTTLKITLDQHLDLELYKKALSKGMIGGATLVNTAILQKESNTNTYFKNQIAPIYQETYTLDNIFTNLGTSIGIISLLPLLLIYLRQTASMLSEK
jgi:hypothetical protein